MNKRVIHLRYLALISLFMGMYVGSMCLMALGLTVTDSALYAVTTVWTFLFVIMLIDKKVRV